MKKYLSQKENVISALFLTLVLGMILIAPSIAGLTSSTDIGKGGDMIPRSTGGWELQDSGTMHGLYGLSFGDENNGTVVGGTYPNPIILHTSDGGAQWNLRMDGVDPHKMTLLTDVSFYNETIGMACGMGGVIYTTNGGISWTHVDIDGWGMFYGGHMVTPLIGFAVGTNAVFEPSVIRTTDGWQTHDINSFRLEYEHGSYEADLMDVHFVDPMNGFAAARVCFGRGAIIRTTDCGDTWETMYFDMDNLIDMDFPTATVGYAVGHNGTLVKSIDGGAIWTRQPIGPRVILTDVSFATEDIGIIVGERGLIFRTINGGASWNTQRSGVSRYLNEIQLLDVHEGFIIGEYGKILHTSTGGLQLPDPVFSTITLTDEGYPGLTTCPAGDGSTYYHVNVVLLDDQGDPIEDMLADDIEFLITPDMETDYFDELTCRFTPLSQATDANGEIAFELQGTTSIVGNITIRGMVLGVELVDSEMLKCISYDHNVNGIVDLPDFAYFATQGWSLQNLECDYNWDETVNLVDFAMFASHYGHVHS